MQMQTYVENDTSVKLGFFITLTVNQSIVLCNVGTYKMTNVEMTKCIIKVGMCNVTLQLTKKIVYNIKVDIY